MHVVNSEFIFYLYLICSLLYLRYLIINHYHVSHFFCIFIFLRYLIINHYLVSVSVYIVEHPAHTQGTRG
jgi:hypothetical protein